MNSIDDLIAHYKRRESTCASERDRAAGMEGKKVTDAHRRQIASVWEKDRQIARDTVAYLEVIQRRGLSAGSRSIPLKVRTVPSRRPKGG